MEWLTGPHVRPPPRFPRSVNGWLRYSGPRYCVSRCTVFYDLTCLGITTFPFYFLLSHPLRKRIMCWDSRYYHATSPPLWPANDSFGTCETALCSPLFVSYYTPILSLRTLLFSRWYLCNLVKNHGLLSRCVLVFVTSSSLCESLSSYKTNVFQRHRTK